MIPYFSNISTNFNYLYYLVELSRIQISPFRIGIISSLEWFENRYNPIYDTNFGRFSRASLELIERITRTYKKPEFGITKVTVESKEYDIQQNIVLNKHFCKLLHFEKTNLKTRQPKLLIVAPMAGHHATLLKGTVEDTLPHFDVYITDWIDANQVPLNLGKFDMDDFIDYIIEFMEFLGQDLSIMAVCQPTVPVLAATAILSSQKSKLIPKSLILMGGPVDARKNPTAVNKFATSNNIEWFEDMVITSVPPNYPGYMRQVYPGFLQLLGFMSLNIQLHIDSHFEIFKNLLIEDDEQADIKKKFYNEYLSVMDLPAEFYLQTIKEVFQDFSLAKGTLVSRGRHIDLKSISNTAILGIEGGKDDIAAVGQTKAALELCSKVSDSKKRYHLQKDVGHYGVFSGSRFRNFIVPVIKDFVYNI